MEWKSFYVINGEYYKLCKHRLTIPIQCHLQPPTPLARTFSFYLIGKVFRFL